MKLSFLLVLSLLTAPVVLAQPGERETRAERAERMLDRRLDLLDERLDLTAAQETRIRQIFVRQHQRLRARAEAERADTERRREEHRARREAEQHDPEAKRRRREQEFERMRREWDALDREIRSVLTRPQARAYTELRREEMRRFQDRMRERRKDDVGGETQPERTRVLVLRRPNGN